MKKIIKWAVLTLIPTLLWRGVPKSQGDVREFIFTGACLLGLYLLGFIFGASSRLAFYQLEKLIGLGNLYPGLSIVGVIVKRAQRTATWQVIMLCLLLLAVVADFLLRKTWNLPLLWVWLIMSLLCYSRLKLLEFRVGMGHYGDNESEAREIINFIVNEAKDPDISGGGTTREIFNEQDLLHVEDGLQMPAIDGEPA